VAPPPPSAVTGQAPRLLVIEDEAHLAAGLKLNLELEGFTVDVARTGREAGRMLLEPVTYDALLLDVMLPDLSGYELCARLREAGDLTPVLMLTARDGVEDRVAGLEAGADDYLGKPFELAELLARVQSLLRRTRWARAAQERRGEGVGVGEAAATIAGVRVDFERMQATRGEGEPVKLTKLEWDLLQYLVRNPERVLSREELQEKVWKVQGYGNPRTVDNFMLRLRRAFERDPAAPEVFVSVRGAGYRFVPTP
jgi:DNA-binding response OmpR family regulator